jgi:hypothetical protein
LITNDKGNFEMAVTMIEYQPKVLQYFAELKETVSILDSMPIAEAIAALQEARLQERRIFVMGNGGSATTANIEEVGEVSVPDVIVIRRVR